MAKLPNEKYFEYFQTICNIEHASYYPQKIIPALKKLILELGYQPKIDAQHNLFFKIPASRGYEKRPSVLLQAHTDMVFVSKKNSKNKNVKIQVNGDKLSANGTSLGADNGIGVSYILAIAADHKIRHPELEILLTWNEEVTPQGITKFNYHLIKSRYMINLDNEDLAKVEIGCAGVKRYLISCSLPDSTSLHHDNTYTQMAFTIAGLKGGHSGANIGALRANAIALMFNILYAYALETNDFGIAFNEIINPANVIPSSSSIDLLLPKQKINQFKQFVRNRVCQYQKFFRDENPIKYTFLPISKKQKYFNLKDEINQKLLCSLGNVPNPVPYYNEQFQMYEVSYNWFQFTPTKTGFTIGISVRATNENGFALLVQQMLGILRLANLNPHIISRAESSLTWTPVFKKHTDSFPLLTIYQNAFKKITKNNVISEICKGGLECGFIVNKIPTMQAISIGPDIFEPHSVDENSSIKSIRLCYKIILQTLKKIN